MNLNILLGLIGILVSIGVGFGTFYVADRRSRRNRWQNAKDMVLRDLSKSLGWNKGTGIDILIKDRISIYQYPSPIIP